MPGRSRPDQPPGLLVRSRRCPSHRFEHVGVPGSTREIEGLSSLPFQEELLAWQPAATADGPLSYRAVLDGRPLRTPPGAMSLRLPGAGLGDGAHRVQVLATDVDGESTLTPPAVLKVDGRPPTLQVLRAGHHSVVLWIRDAGSGVDVRSVRVSFGDGAHARGRARARHSYSRGGIYQVVIQVRDRVGNRASIKRVVSVP